MKHIVSQVLADEAHESLKTEEIKHLAAEQKRLFVEVQEIKHSIEGLKKLIVEMSRNWAQERQS